MKREFQVGELAKILNVARSTVITWIKNGEIEAYQLPGGINRIPRPALALGTLGLFVTAMVDPIWFAARMQGIALVPEPLWWLLGVVVSFYFGARHQMKTQEFQKSVAQTMAVVPKVAENLQVLRDLKPQSPGVADTGPDARLRFASVQPEDNPALAAWQRTNARPATK
jgi:excisionase family DNA binding protein